MKGAKKIRILQVKDYLSCLTNTVTIMNTKGAERDTNSLLKKDHDLEPKESD